MVVGRLIRALDRPVDAASAALFRIAFGILIFASTVRFLWHGWVEEYYRAPRFFFHYWGLAWLEPLPISGMYAVYALIALGSLCVALGVLYRPAALVLAIAFSYAHACDKTNYLNHYYLISLLAGLMVFLPLDRQLSLRVWRKPHERRGQIRAYALYLLRFQLGVVYVFGGIGKLGADWLLRGEPLHIWLSANAEIPLLGRLLVQPWAGLAFGWCGALFDLLIVPLLLWPVTRRSAYAVLVVFHALTALLFHIGLFPWLMIALSPIFWGESWPRRWLRGAADPGVAGAPLGTLGRGVGSLYVAAQLLLPLRSALYPGNTLWTEEGFRFSWKVMLIEKAGSLDFDVVDGAGRRYSVPARDYLTRLQTRLASTQPDMVLELAHVVARDFEARGLGPVRVYADCEVSFNGRSRARLIDRNVDLARIEDGLQPKSWILPAPTSEPLF